MRRLLLLVTTVMAAYTLGATAVLMRAHCMETSRVFAEPIDWPALPVHPVRSFWSVHHTILCCDDRNGRLWIRQHEGEWPSNLRQLTPALQPLAPDIILVCNDRYNECRWMEEKR